MPSLSTWLLAMRLRSQSGHQLGFPTPCQAPPQSWARSDDANRPTRWLAARIGRSQLGTRVPGLGLEVDIGRRQLVTSAPNGCTGRLPSCNGSCHGRDSWGRALVVGIEDCCWHSGAHNSAFEEFTWLERIAGRHLRLLPVVVAESLPCITPRAPIRASATSCTVDAVPLTAIISMQLASSR